MDKIPIDDTIIYALANLVDDAQSETRSPSHANIEFQFNRVGLSQFDPNKSGSKPVGKAKRVRGILFASIDDYRKNAEEFAAGIIACVRSCGGFRPESPNYVGQEAITNLANALKPHGVQLDPDGSIFTVRLDTLTGKNLTSALEKYVTRARKGVEDGALIVGTSKDLMEAVAAHILQELWGHYPQQSNFPTLLGQAFTALGMATPAKEQSTNEHARCRLERSMYETACAVNNLRNKEGTGHGRPWNPDLSPSEINAAIEFIGILSGMMLDKLKQK